MSNLAFQDTFEPYYEGRRDGLPATPARDGTVHRLPPRTERRQVDAPPIAPPVEKTDKR